MKKILLVCSPFCTPATPPYSITNLYSFLKKNLNDKIEILDLNLEFHKNKFRKYHKYFHSELKDYDKVAEDFIQLTKKTYFKSNDNVVNGKKPELFDELFKILTDKKPDIIIFSIVYSSQAFYAYSILKKLKELRIKTFIGGPAVNPKLKSLSTCLNNEIELLKELGKNSQDFNYCADFKIYKLKDYFSPKPVIPIKTSSTCYYKRCTFCTHFLNQTYFEFPLKNIKDTITSSAQKHFFLIDDMIPKKRLLQLAKIFKPLNITWACQLRPTREFDYKTLKTLYDSGLKIIMWGVESANNRVLKLINKGTNKKDTQAVLNDSHKAGIKNIVYIIFGYPTETISELTETVDFLKINQKSIDLISVSMFGLQYGSEIYNYPDKFGITKIKEEKRTILEPKLSFETSSGMTRKQALNLRQKYNKDIININKFPSRMNFFREHMLCLV